MGDTSNLVIAAIDVGSPRNIGWAILHGKEQQTGQDLDQFIEVFSELAIGRPAALGFEAPLFIPVHSELGQLTAQRPGENGKPWSAGAGATVTTIGLAIMTYTLTNLRTRLSAKSATLDWNNWPNNDELLLFEAFVSGKNHAGPGDHWHDALTAATGFRDALSNLGDANAVKCDEVLSLVGTCMIRSGWSNPSLELLRQSCLVIRPSELAQI